jgi:hypothetical protein
MTHRTPLFAFFAAAVLASSLAPCASHAQAAAPSDPAADFRTSSRCMVCHNNLKTSTGEDVSIGFEWRASIMANSARDPYWQGSVRRETLDHPSASVAIQNECAVCHMPAQHFIDTDEGHPTEVLSRLPLKLDSNADAAAADGVTCTVCHQIQSTGLGTPATYNGNVAVAGPAQHPRIVYGPYLADPVHVALMHTSATGYTPTQAAHIRDAGLCGSCHTLYTPTLGPDGKQIGRFPEQMPYIEWLHSDYRDKQTCQQCHMPAVKGAVKIASLFAEPRDGVHQHTFTGANFLMEDMLNTHHDELAVAALPTELAAEAARTKAFLQTQAAHVSLTPLQLAGNNLTFAVRVENLTGHKLPTAYPSRRAWLHVTVTAANGSVIFESGKLNPDGSIVGNVNDTDPTRYSPHYTTITAPDQVQIFEPILGDSADHVTTGLLTATHYLKDNRILPTGFDKQTATPDIAVMGKALADPDFTAGSATTHYAIPASAAQGPFRVAVELVYQPIGFRWAHNLAPYQAAEPQRFVGYYKQAAAQSALVLAHAEATAPPTAAAGN